jgi:hypothetical protein
MAFHCSKKWLYNIYHFQEFTARDFWLGASSCVADQLNVHLEHSNMSNMSERREMRCKRSLSKVYIVLENVSLFTWFTTPPSACFTLPYTHLNQRTLGFNATKPLHTSLVQ